MQRHPNTVSAPVSDDESLPTATRSGISLSQQRWLCSFVRLSLRFAAIGSSNSTLPTPVTATSAPLPAHFSRAFHSRTQRPPHLVDVCATRDVGRDVQRMHRRLRRLLPSPSLRRLPRQVRVRVRRRRCHCAVHYTQHVTCQERTSVSNSLVAEVSLLSTCYGPRQTHPQHVNKKELFGIWRNVLKSQHFQCVHMLAGRHMGSMFDERTVVRECSRTRISAAGVFRVFQSTIRPHSYGTRGVGPL